MIIISGRGGVATGHIVDPIQVDRMSFLLITAGHSSPLAVRVGVYDGRRLLLRDNSQNINDDERDGFQLTIVVSICVHTHYCH